LAGKWGQGSVRNRGAWSPPENGKWKSWHRKLAPLLEIGRKIWGENGGDTAAGGSPEMGKEISGKEKMWREKMWGENVFWRCEYWLTRVALKFGGKCLATLERDRRETDKSLTFSISLIMLMQGFICFTSAE
jgi:hypothetical protein